MVARIFVLLALAWLITLSACSTQDSSDSVSDVESTSQTKSDPVYATSDTDEDNIVRTGVWDDRVLFGQSAAFTGPVKHLGIGMRNGIMAAFHEINLEGAVHGRKLELTHLDDSYEPEAAIANTRYLIEEAGVFALLGAVGTPTSRSAAQIAVDGSIPYVAPFTGAAFLRESSLERVINVRASYAQETEEMVQRLTTDLAIKRIAVVYQDDSFGRAGFLGAKDALLRRGLEPVAIGIYPRNTLAIKTALLNIVQKQAEAVIIVGTYQPVAHLISWARHIGYDPEFVTTSFVGSNALVRELGEKGAGVFITQVVPFPTDDSIPIVATYLEAMRTYAPGEPPGFVSLEGYIAGRLVIAGIKQCGRELSRACFIDELQNAEAIDLDGFELMFGQNDNQGSDRVFLTVIGSDGQLHPIDTMTDELP